MNIKNVISLKISKELKEAGFNKVTQFLWVKYNDVTDNNKEKWDITMHFWSTKEIPHEYYYVPLATEILEELPDTIEFSKKNCSIRISSLSINSIRNYCVCYENYDDEDFNTDVIRDKSLADALARMWLYLKKENILKGESMTKLPVKTPRELTENFIDDYISQRERGTTLKDCKLAIDNFFAQSEECYRPKYVRKYKDFEDYLMEVHGEQYVGTKDCMIDDFNKWVQELGCDEFIEYGNKFAKEMK